jgi:hypothetical protein
VGGVLNYRLHHALDERQVEPIQFKLPDITGILPNYKNYMLHEGCRLEFRIFIDTHWCETILFHVFYIIMTGHGLVCSINTKV